MQRDTLVGLDFAGRDEELHLIWISGYFHIRQSLCPSGGTDQPHEGEHHSHYEVLMACEGREKRYRDVDSTAVVSDIMSPWMSWYKMSNTRIKYLNGTVMKRSQVRGHCTHNERSSAVFMVLVLKEDVDDGGHERIQEGKDGNGDKELCRG